MIETPCGRIVTALPREAPRYAVLELCRNRAGYEAAPERKLALDLDVVQVALEEGGFETLANARIILVSRIGVVEVSVFESGKLLFKTKDAARAYAGMQLVFAALGWGEPEVRVTE